MKKFNWRYWLCQVLGWGLWCAFTIYIYFVVYKEMFESSFGDGKETQVAKNKFWLSLLITFVCAIVVTHLLRFILKKLDWMQYAINQVIFIFLIGAIGTGFVFYFATDKLEKHFNVSIEQYRNNMKLNAAKINEVDFGLGVIDYYKKENLKISDVQKNTIQFIQQNYKLQRNINGDWVNSDTTIKDISEELILKAKKVEIDSGLVIVNYYNKDSAKLSKTEKKAIQVIKNATGWKRSKTGSWMHKNNSNLVNIYQYIILTALWLLIYFVWHYVGRNRNDQLARLKLETTVKELELKTIKAHINPHFIFNSLNSIRALVDENPERARKAITELSNLLRSSMQAEKNETVTLEKEMKIVEDYLALEKIRFEDRLQIEYHIDDDTLDQQVPPMMLQTIVENAIKHGVSKQINGGKIIIYSDFVDNHYELKVENTGTLEKNQNTDGFGLKSTLDRIAMLFGKASNFTITQKTENLVSAKVSLPIKINS